MKLALVTGGFRRLGAAIAARLASDGWTLALHCREAAEPDHELAAILALHKTQWQGFSCDLADGVAVSGLLERVVRHFGTSPELIVNNASRFAADDATSLTPGELSAHMAVNLSAPVLLATGMAALLDMGNTGVVINITDQRVRHPNGDQLSYTLSKQALAAATTTLARVLAPKVRVNAVAPGYMATDNTAPLRQDAQRSSEILSRIPAERWGTPEDLQGAVVFLSSSAADYVNGYTLAVDGGWLCR